MKLWGDSARSYLIFGVQGKLQVFKLLLQWKFYLLPCRFVVFSPRKANTCGY